MLSLALFLLLVTDGEATTGASTGVTDGLTDGSTDADTLGPMPPVYEPCGCRGAGEGGGWALLALALTAGSRCRRRRPTT